MIKIKDYIFNENEILQITKGMQNTLFLTLKYSDRLQQIDNATIEDIEWNYGTPQETQRQMQKELCKSCYYRNNISNKLKELEEENERLLNKIEILEDDLETEKSISSNLAKNMIKAVEYLEHEQFEKNVLSFNAIINKTKQILKGGEYETTI
jgi:ATP-dependent exoDNAse (exonuclease V) beta subunit